MTTYQSADRLIELFKGNPSREDVIVEVMKIQGWSDKQSELFAIKEMIKRELPRLSTTQMRDILINNYNYSYSRAYELIRECEKFIK